MADYEEGTVRLPLPVQLPPQADAARSLAINVRGYFRASWPKEDEFRDFLASVGNKDAITGNRMFDRYRAVAYIKSVAKAAGDNLTANAKDGDVYKHIVHAMGKYGMGLQVRREAYKALTHKAAAE